MRFLSSVIINTILKLTLVFCRLLLGLTYPSPGGCSEYLIRPPKQLDEPRPLSNQGGVVSLMVALCFQGSGSANLLHLGTWLPRVPIGMGI